MRVVHVSAGGPVFVEPLIVDDSFVGVHRGRALRVFDVRGNEPRVVLEVADLVAAAKAGSSFVTLCANGEIARWEQGVGGWRRGPGFRLPPVPDRDELVASLSGRYAFVDGKRGTLVDLEAERVITEIAADYGTARPSFDRLPDGRDVLFVAATGYMSVRMIEVATGSILASYEEQSSHDFCHVDFALARDATRLVTFGCFWAWPYDVVIYDATPWTAGAPPSTDVPLPIVRRIEPTASNGLLAAHVDADGDVTSACLDRRKGEDTHTLILQRVDPSDGHTVHQSVYAIPPVDEHRVRYVSGHRVVVFGPRLLMCHADSERLEDFGDLALSSDTQVAVTPDGSTAIIVGP